MTEGKQDAGREGGREGPSMAELQAWFGRAISRPLPKEYRGNPLAASHPELKEEGDALLNGPGGLPGFDRVGIYNQQYWFRLLSIMQGEYPCAVHAMGLKPFNAQVIRYLDAHPPSSPFLARLDGALLDFLRKDYAGPDREAVLQAAEFDKAFSKAVDAPDGVPLGEAAGTDQPDAGAGSPRMVLAPHAAALRLDWDFPTYRALCLADESLEGIFELKPHPHCLIVWRGADGILWQKAVSIAAWKVLRQLREPSTLEAAFDRLEGAFSPEEQADLEANLAEWFGEWTREGILTTPDPRSG